MIWGTQGKVVDRHQSHVHDMHEIFVCLNNHGVQWINGMRYPFRKGTVFFLPGDVPHHVEGTAEKPGEFMFVCFDPQHFNTRIPRLHQLLLSLREKNVHVWRGRREKGARFLSLIGSILKETETNLPYSEESAEAYLAQLIIEFARGVEVEDRKAPEPHILKLEKICETIKESPTQKYRLEDMAKRCGMCRTRFAKEFKRLTGSTLVDFINDCRVKRALELLVQGELAIGDIALEAGFANMGHFHTIFKRRMGKTPLTMRNIIRANGVFPKILNEKKVTD